MNKLSDLVIFISGSPQFRIIESIDEPSPSYYVYSQEDLLNDLSMFEMITEERKVMRTNDDVNTLSEGDVVFSLISGTASRVSRFREGYLYTQNYIKLLPLKNMDSKFLVYLLNENDFVKKQLRLGLQGSVVIKYTLKQLKEIQIQILPQLDRQKILGEIYFKQLRLQALKKRVIQYETEIVLQKLQEEMENDRASV